MMCDKCGKKLVSEYVVATEMMDTDKQYKQYVVCDFHCFDDLANFLDLGECHLELVNLEMTEDRLIYLIDKFEGIIDSDEDMYTEEEHLELFSYLIKTGMGYTLQSMYSKECDYLIEAEYIDRFGNIL